ncbi:MAG TPA: type II secretion system protein GspN [Polyangiaceae bacterium]|nr:type II secretion system protein GspN [Polyangiaceae bacterium]
MKFPKLNLPKLPNLPKLKYLKWVGYVFAYLLAFLVFAYLSFPYDRLRQYVISTYNATQTPPSQNRLEIDSLTWSWRFPGIVAEGVRLVVPPPPAPEAEKPVPPQYLEAKEVYISASALALLTGAREASFGAEALDGDIAGWARDSSAGRRLELQLDGVNPGSIPQLEATIGLPLAGSISGQISVDIPEGNFSKAEGTVDLSAEDLVLGDGKAKIKNTIALPELHMGAFVLKAQIGGGKLKIDECTSQGRDLELALTGSLRLRPKLENSVADLELKFSFGEKYRSQSDTTKALFGQPDSKIPGLFDTATSGHLTKAEDGSYGSRLTGTLARLTPRPLGTARRSKDATSTGSRRRSRVPTRRGGAAEEEEGTEDAEEQAP